MGPHGRTSVRLVAGLAALVVGFAAVPAVATADGARPGETAPTLTDVARANVRYHSIAKAERDGYSGDVVPMCMDHPTTGGMGVHWINVDLLTDGLITPTRPEALVYELGPRGKKTLVAVEWVMPPNDMYPPAPDGGSGPTLYGQEFSWHPTLQVWKLHAWLYRANPTGVFQDYNPDVSACPAT